MSENEKTEKLEYQTEEKIEGLTEPIEGEKDIESEPAQGETVDGGGSPKRKRRIVAAAVLGVAVIALCIAGIVGAATPSEAPQPEKSQPEQETVAPKNDQKYSLAVKIEAEGWTDTATKATVRVEAAAPHGEMEPIEREVECGENIVLVEADEFVKDATYKVSVSKAPVLEDGSTYTAGEPFELKAPSDAAASASNTVRSLGLEWDNEREDAMVMFETVSADEKKIIVNITLAPKALADMSAEEVEASATALEAAGKSDAAQAAVQSAPATSGNAVQSGGTGGGSTSGGGSSEPAPEPDPPAHVHNWIPETTEKTIYHNFCGICGADIQGNEAGHLKNHALAGEGVGLSVSCRDGDCEHWPLLLLLWGVEIEESKANEMGEGNDRQLAERRRRHTASPAVRSDGYHASGDAGDTTGIGLSRSCSRL